MPTYPTAVERSAARRASTSHPRRWWAATIGVLVAACAAFVHAGEGAPSNQLTIGWAIVLGAVQGATEFLPVSSSGHLSLGQALLGIDAQSVGHRFNITVHAGTLIAVAWVYRRDVVALFRAALRPHVPSEERTRLLMMALATSPLVVVLIPAVEDFIIGFEGNIRAVGFALWTTAALLFVAFRGQASTPAVDSTTPPRPWQALLIGLAQLLAVLPGISRSGSTIAAGLQVGLDRAAAARFSFLISLPAVGAAALKELLEVLAEPPAAGPTDPIPFIAGFVTSLVVGLLSLRGLLYLVGKGRVGVFVVYLVVVGAAAVAVG